MKVVGIIPARYASSRFPGKPLVNILGIPMIIRVCEIVEKALGKENVYVATDDDRISAKVHEYGYKFIKTSDSCPTGTDRLWEASNQIEADIYINIQGDEPLINPLDIIKVVNAKKSNMECVINGMNDLDFNDAKNINIPKVLVNRNNYLIYMSRLPIPGIKSEISEMPNYKKQVCIYGFTYNDLKAFGLQAKKSDYEKYEDIEILRFFDLGIPVKMIELSGNSLAVDVPTDVKKVEEFIQDKAND